MAPKDPKLATADVLTAIAFGLPLVALLTAVIAG